MVVRVGLIQGGIIQRGFFVLGGVFHSLFHILWVSGIWVGRKVTLGLGCMCY